MATYHDGSYPEPDELQGMLWAPHLVKPDASWISELRQLRTRHVPGATPSQFEESSVNEPYGSLPAYNFDDIYEDGDGDGSFAPLPRPEGPFLPLQFEGSRKSDRRNGSDFDLEGDKESGQSETDPSSFDYDSDEDHQQLGARSDYARSRGRGRGRGRRNTAATSRGPRRGRGRGGFKPQLAEIDEGLGLLGKERRRGGSRGRAGETRMPRRKAGTRRRKKDVLPSLEFKQLHEEASRAYIEGDYERAEDAISQAIEKNPEIPTVHSLLAEILEAKGEKVRAPWVLFAGAHVRPREPQAWLEAAEGIREFMSRQTPEELAQLIQADGDTAITLQEQCVNYLTHCYGQAISLDRNNCSARKRRAVLLRDIGHPRKALQDYKYLIEHKVFDVFRDSDALEFVAQEHLRSSEPEKGILFFDTIMFSRYDEDNLLDMLDWHHVALLVEMYLMANMPDKALVNFKKFARILLGRPDEDFWDDVVQDDREFDLEDEPRRCEILEFLGNSGEHLSYGAALPLDLRIKMGLLRLQRGDLDEALQHFDWIRYNSGPQVVQDLSDLYLEAAGALHDAAYFNEALTFYTPLQNIGFQMTGSDIDRLAHCYEEAAQYDQAEELYLKLAEENLGDLVPIEKLARMFSNAELNDRAEPYLQRLSEERRKRLRSMDFSSYPMSTGHRRMDVEINSTDENSDDGDGEGLPNRASAFRTLLARPVVFSPREPSGHSRRLRLPRAQGVNMTLKQQLMALDEDDVLAAFEEMQACELNIAENRQDWMDLASKVLQIFRAQKVFYPYDKYQRFWGYSTQARSLAMKAKVEQELLEKELLSGKRGKFISLAGTDFEGIPTEFCSVSFSTWLDTFMQYAIYRAIDGRFEEAFDSCQAAFDANVFYHSKSAVEKIYYVWAACAALSDDEETISSVTREIMKNQQYVGDSYRLYSAMNLVKRLPNSSFNSSNNQKFLLRHIKAMDWALLSEQERNDRKEELSTRAKYTRIDPKTEEPILPTEVSCELLMTYALMLYAGQSQYEALAYMTRVYALRPQDPLLNLLMGLSYIACAFKRQSFNRQFQIMQGLAMISCYYEMRMKSENLIDRQEAVFNMGRSYQLLGLTHLSLPYYERCLQMGDELKEQESEENFAVEAAFALQGILAAQGQLEKAQEILEKWLVL